MSTSAWIAVVAAGLTLATAGCGPQSATQPDPAAGPPTGQVVNVVAKEFAFDPKELRVKAGPVMFLVRNEGAVEHEFMIEGVTKHAGHAAETFRPGATHEVRVELTPGVYPVSCNVAGHREAGMVGSIIVE